MLLFRFTHFIACCSQSFYILDEPVQYKCPTVARSHVTFLKCFFFFKGHILNSTKTSHLYPLQSIQIGTANFSHVDTAIVILLLSLPPFFFVLTVVLVPFSLHFYSKTRAHYNYHASITSTSTTPAASTAFAAIPTTIAAAHP